jgi:hypothetical protein
MVALFVILTIVVCVGIDGIVQLRKAKQERVSLNLADQLVPAEAFANLSAPANLFLDSGHTWVEVKPSGAATIGLDGFAQKLIGRIDDVNAAGGWQSDQSRRRSVCRKAGQSPGSIRFAFGWSGDCQLIRSCHGIPK